MKTYTAIVLLQDGKASQHGYQVSARNPKEAKERLTEIYEKDPTVFGENWKLKGRRMIVEYTVRKLI